MKNKIVICLLAFWVPAFFGGGCQRIHEPWIRSPDQLKEERLRTEQVRMELRQRFVRVQADR